VSAGRQKKAKHEGEDRGTSSTSSGHQSTTKTPTERQKKKKETGQSNSERNATQGVEGGPPGQREAWEERQDGKQGSRTRTKKTGERRHPKARANDKGGGGKRQDEGGGAHQLWSARATKNATRR